ncbi:hypothetical protein ACFOYW_08305 [Gryllotalpicola reticulitermitis]|uniref:Cytochrome c domain-containing protein n=1 Tax=Gryllotalpicola reticulitermitis TaxID=1184153 RepID=A0ABV8Q6Z3_9MICO
MPVNVSAVRASRLAAQRLASRVDDASARANAAFASRPSQQVLVYGSDGNTALGLIAVADIEKVQVVADPDDIDGKAAAGPVLLFDAMGDPVGFALASALTEVPEVQPVGAPQLDNILPPGPDMPGALPNGGVTPSIQASGKKPGCATCGKPHGPSFHSHSAPRKQIPTSMQAVAQYVVGLSVEERETFADTVSRALRF